MKNKLIILFCGFLTLFIIGLFSCDDGCGPFPNKFKIVGLDWLTYKAIYADSAESRLVLSTIENDSVSYQKFSIFITPRQETYSAQNYNKWNFNLIQTAYACSPVLPQTDEKIEGIILLSTKDFDVNHPAGTDLADLFDVVVLDQAKGIYYEKFSLEDYLKTKPHVPTEMTLILRGQPDTTTDYAFLVKYYQNGIGNNDYFEFTTSPIVIKRNE